MLHRLARRLLPLLALALAGLPTLEGQEVDAEERGRFIGGIVAGVNLSQIDGDLLAGFHLPGFNVGGQVSAVLAPRWQLGIEMLFSQQGSRRNLNDPPSATFDRIRLQFVEVPVMLRFLEWKFRLNAGFSYARLINYTAEDVFGEDVSDQQNFRSDLLYVRVGATYFFTPHLGLNLGWNKSLINLEREGDSGTLLPRNLSFRAVYLF